LEEGEKEFKVLPFFGLCEPKIHSKNPWTGGRREEGTTVREHLAEVGSDVKMKSKKGRGEGLKLGLGRSAQMHRGSNLASAA